MENKSSSLLEGLKGEEFDLLKDYAQPYSISVIGRLLGVPEDVYEKILDWSNKIVKMYDKVVIKILPMQKMLKNSMNTPCHIDEKLSHLETI